MKANPAKIARAFEQLIMLKGKQVSVINHDGTRYDGELHIEEGFVSGFELISRRSASRQCVVRVAPLARLIGVTGSTIKVNLSTILEVWSQGKAGIGQQLFFGSNIDHINLHEAKQQDKMAAERERIHYLEPGEIIKSVRVHADGVTIWVERMA